MTGQTFALPSDAGRDVACNPRSFRSSQPPMRLFRLSVRHAELIHTASRRGTAHLCLQNLNQTMRYGGRKYLLSGMEVEEITVLSNETNGKILRRQVYTLPGGNKKVVNTKSITVVAMACRNRQTYGRLRAEDSE
ncbi:hypothetical protein COOONC_18699 [Cooperia oncophora]